MIPLRTCLFTLGLALSLSLPAAAQRADDGFLRHNGSTYVVRHGQLRPLTKEVHLPNGRTITPDGFVLAADGSRRELAEGHGCDLRGNLVVGQQQGNGIWALGGASAPAPAPVFVSQGYLDRLPPGQRKKWLKHLGKGKKHGRKHEDD